HMRTQLSRLLFTAILGGTIAASAGRSYAGPDHDRHDRREERREDRREGRREERREERREDRREDHREVVRDHRHPYEAPPAVRIERHGERRGCVWINGGWDWRDGRYVWVGGRYEPERRGYR